MTLDIISISEIYREEINNKNEKIILFAKHRKKNIYGVIIGCSGYAPPKRFLGKWALVHFDAAMNEIGRSVRPHFSRFLYPKFLGGSLLHFDGNGAFIGYTRGAKYETERHFDPQGKQIGMTTFAKKHGNEQHCVHIHRGSPDLPIPFLAVRAWRLAKEWKMLRLLRNPISVKGSTDREERCSPT